MFCKIYLQKAGIAFFSLDVVHVWEERGRQVPALINTDEIHGIEVLIKYRSDYVNPNNFISLLFQTTNQKHIFVEMIVSIGYWIKFLTLKHQKGYFGTTNFYYGTSQVLCYSVTNSWLRLADHMGHNLDVHRSYYHLKDSKVELSKVARLLLATNEGHANKFAGKKLSKVRFMITFF